MEATLFLHRKKAEDTLTGRLEDLESAIRDLTVALREMREDLDWTQGAIERIRGRITGGLRKREDAPQPTNGGAPVVKGTPEWFEAERRKAHVVPRQSG